MQSLRRFVSLRALAACAVFVLLGSAFASAAGTLPRRGILGVGTADTNGAVTITAVLPCAQAGLQKDDVIVSVDGAPVANSGDFVRKLRRPGGQPVTLGIKRGGTTMTVRPVLLEAPKESDPAVDTRYAAVEVDNSLRRALVSAPHGASGKHPAVLFIGGIGCYSVDVASNPEDPYMRLAHDLAKRGFVSLRLEKSGVGDSQGPPCPTVDFVTETRSYAAAFDALRGEPDVDPAHVYIFGHSIGSVSGPRVALDKNAAGVIVAEGVGIGWFEYELINSGRQEELSGAAAADVDRALLLKEDCMHRLLIERKPRTTVLREKPECADYTQYPAPDAYLQQIAPLDMAQPWTKLPVPVLAIYGSADFVTDEADHQRIVSVVNAAHPGNGTLQVIPGMDHYLTNAASQRASFDRVTKGGPPAPYDARFSTAILAWLCARERCLPATG
ncbi:MAG TPA: alpha/beta fold hydrolase [Candidatus Elarobacter sp.]|nr:alpha/beta fold hydrolase [Candidatus Elarobacter sp.]